jgi:hypothetical protein
MEQNKQVVVSAKVIAELISKFRSQKKLSELEYLKLMAHMENLRFWIRVQLNKD